MKKVLLGILVFGLFFSYSWAACPQAPNDPGECDTFHLELYDSANGNIGGYTGAWPRNIYFPMYVTNDVPDPTTDSIHVFLIPLSITHSNATAYCTISTYWNWNVTFGGVNLPRCIWRNFPTNSDTSRMMWWYNEGNGAEWNGKYFDFSSRDSIWSVVGGEYTGDTNIHPHFFMSLLTSSTEDAGWWEGNRVLLATMTLRVQDSMTIVIDSTWWPPTSHMKYGTLTFNYSPRTPTLPLHIVVKQDTSWYWTSSVEEFHQLPSVPGKFVLAQNYPNPFNPTTTIEFAITEPQHITLEVFNVLGRKVETLVSNKRLDAGTYQFNWNASGYPSGPYFYQIRTDKEGRITQKMFLVK